MEDMREMDEILEKYSKLFSNWDKKTDDKIIRDTINRLRDDNYKDFLVDLVEEIEQEVFYQRLANKYENKGEYLDASHVISYLRRKVLELK